MPDKLTMSALRAAVQHCEGCPLYADATQAVFGEGTLTSEVMLVGEQPGDQEDQAGAPFVGPAGKLLDRALDEAGIDRRKTYVTNAVKHFKWKARGTRRIHDSRAGRSRWPAARGSKPSWRWSSRARSS
jgi:DNA polymerase